MKDAIVIIDIRHRARLNHTIITFTLDIAPETAFDTRARLRYTIITFTFDNGQQTVLDSRRIEDLHVLGHDILGVAIGNQPSVVQQKQARAIRFGAKNVMGYQNDRRASPFESIKLVIAFFLKTGISHCEASSMIRISGSVRIADAKATRTYIPLE